MRVTLGWAQRPKNSCSRLLSDAPAGFVELLLQAAASKSGRFCHFVVRQSKPKVYTLRTTTSEYHTKQKTASLRLRCSPLYTGERTDLCRRPEPLEKLVHQVRRSSWEVVLDLGFHLRGKVRDTSNPRKNVFYPFVLREVPQLHNRRQRTHATSSGQQKHSMVPPVVRWRSSNPGRIAGEFRTTHNLRMKILNPAVIRPTMNFGRCQTLRAPQVRGTGFMASQGGQGEKPPTKYLE